MTTTIKNRIIVAAIARLEIIREKYGYNFDGGEYVLRAIRKRDSKKKAAITVWPDMDEVSPHYGADFLEFPLIVEGESAFSTTENPSEIAEAIMGDLIEALTGVLYALPFTSGGLSTPKGGDAVTGNTGGATAIIESVTVATGTFAGGNATGTFYLRRLVGTFESETLTIDDDADAATIAGLISGQHGVNLATGDLADGIMYAGGGVESYPDMGDGVIGVKAEFKIRYKIVRGDPYNQ